MKATLQILLLVFMLITLITACNSDDEPIVFTTDPPEGKIDHNRGINYTFEAASSSGNPITYKVVAPSWIDFDQKMTISGVPDWVSIARLFTISITASDGVNSSKQEFEVQVVLGEIICDQDFGDPSQSKYILPYQVGKSVQVEQTYCPPNPAWGHHNWFAYDFSTQIGDTIVAIRDGQVSFVVENFQNSTRVCGEENFIFIHHTDGTVASYIHLTTNGVLVKVGDQVKQGQVIGLSGDSGCSIGPHVHIAVFRNKQNFDRQSTIPINFRNAKGSYDQNNGLIQDAFYEAMPF